MTFIRKRDPRYKSHLAHQQKATATKASVRSSGQSTPRQQAPVTFVEQAWQKTSHSKLDDADLEWAVAENEDEEEWECVACSKTFRSEAAWDSHERSKKHMQAVERLRREMMEEAEELGLDGEDPDASDSEDGENGEELEPQDAPQPPPRSPSPDDMKDEEVRQADNQHTDIEEDEEEYERSKPSSKQKSTKQSRALSPQLLSKSERRARTRRGTSPDLLGLGNEAVLPGPPVIEEEAPPLKPEMSKRDKRRAREAAKKAKEEQEANVPTVSSRLFSK